MTTPDAALPTEPTAEPIPTPMPAAPPPARRGPLALLAGVVASPRATFAYLRDYGGRAWLWPVLLALVVTVAARLIAVPIERAQAQAALEALQAQLADQLPAGGDGDTFTFQAGGPVGGLPIGLAAGGPGASSVLLDYGLPALGVLGQWLLAAVVLLALGWLLGGRPRAGAVAGMSAWALLVPVAARSLVAMTVMLTTGRVPMPGLTGLDQPAGTAPMVTNIEGGELPEASASGGQVVMIGPGGTADTAGGSLYLSFVRGALLSSLDIYTLWGLLLTGIGLAVTARFHWLKSVVATAGYWAISLAAAALPPVLSMWMMTLSGAGNLVPMP